MQCAFQLSRKVCKKLHLFKKILFFFYWNSFMFYLFFKAPAASSKSKKGKEEEDTSLPLKFSNGKDQRIKEEKNLKVSTRIYCRRFHLNKLNDNRSSKGVMLAVGVPHVLAVGVPHVFSSVCLQAKYTQAGKKYYI